MAKNIEINYNNGTSYDALYPKTIASQVGAGTFSGSFTFGSVPSCSTTPTGTSHLTNKNYVDSAISTAIAAIGGSHGDIAVLTYTGTDTSGTKSLAFPSISGKTIQYLLLHNPIMFGIVGNVRQAVSGGTVTYNQGISSFLYTVGTSSSASNMEIGICEWANSTSALANNNGAWSYTFNTLYRSGNTVYLPNYSKTTYDDDSTSKVYVFNCSYATYTAVAFYF